MVEIAEAHEVVDHNYFLHSSICLILHFHHVCVHEPKLRYIYPTKNKMFHTLVEILAY